MQQQQTKTVSQSRALLKLSKFNYLPWNISDWEVALQTHAQVVSCVKAYKKYAEMDGQGDFYYTPGYINIFLKS